MYSPTLRRLRRWHRLQSRKTRQQNPMQVRLYSDACCFSALTWRPHIKTRADCSVDDPAVRRKTLGPELGCHRRGVRATGTTASKRESYLGRLIDKLGSFRVVPWRRRVPRRARRRQAAGRHHIIRLRGAEAGGKRVCVGLSFCRLKQRNAWAGPAPPLLPQFHGITGCQMTGPPRPT